MQSPMQLSSVGATRGGRHGPVIFGDTGPEDPDHDNRKKGEQGGEESAVDCAVGAVADVHTDHVLEDLANGEKETGGGKVDWIMLVLVKIGAHALECNETYT